MFCPCSSVFNLVSVLIICNFTRQYYASCPKHLENSLYLTIVLQGTSSYLIDCWRSRIPIAVLNTSNLCSLAMCLVAFLSQVYNKNYVFWKGLQLFSDYASVSVQDTKINTFCKKHTFPPQHLYRRFFFSFFILFFKLKACCLCVICSLWN